MMSKEEKRRLILSLVGQWQQSGRILVFDGKIKFLRMKGMDTGTCNISN